MRPAMFLSVVAVVLLSAIATEAAFELNLNMNPQTVDGLEWTSDEAYLTTLGTSIRSKASRVKSFAASAAAPVGRTILRDYRWGGESAEDLSYSFDLKGTYTVYMYFAEAFFTARGNRIFDIVMEVDGNSEVLERDVDLYAQSRNDVKTVSIQVKPSTNFKIHLIGKTNNAIINAIRIIGEEQTTTSSSTSTTSTTEATTIPLEECVDEELGQAVGLVSEGQKRVTPLEGGFAQPCDSLSFSAPIRFLWMAPETGNFDIYVRSRDMDTLLTVSQLDNKGLCQTTSIGCNDDVQSGVADPLVNINAFVGTNYVIDLDSFAMESGHYELYIQNTLSDLCTVTDLNVENGDFEDGDEFLIAGDGEIPGWEFDGDVRVQLFQGENQISLKNGVLVQELGTYQSNQIYTIQVLTARFPDRDLRPHTITLVAGDTILASASGNPAEGVPDLVEMRLDTSLIGAETAEIVRGLPVELKILGSAAGLFDQSRVLIDKVSVSLESCVTTTTGTTTGTTTDATTATTTGSTTGTTTGTTTSSTTGTTSGSTSGTTSGTTSATTTPLETFHEDCTMLSSSALVENGDFEATVPFDESGFAGESGLSFTGWDFIGEFSTGAPFNVDNFESANGIAPFPGVEGQVLWLQLAQIESTSMYEVMADMQYVFSVESYEMSAAVAEVLQLVDEHGISSVEHREFFLELLLDGEVVDSVVGVMPNGEIPGVTTISFKSSFETQGKMLSLRIITGVAASSGARAYYIFLDNVVVRQYLCEATTTATTSATTTGTTSGTTSATTTDTTTPIPEPCQIDYDLATRVGKGLWAGVVGSDSGELTDQHVPSCAMSFTDETVLLWTCPCAGTFAVDTMGSKIDTVLTVVSDLLVPGECDKLECGCDDDDLHLMSSTVEFDCRKAGGIFYFVIHGAGYSIGEVAINVAKVSTELEQTASASLTTSTCEKAMVVATLIDNALDNNPSFQPSCATLSDTNEYIVEFTPSTTGDYVFDTENSGFDTVLQIFGAPSSRRRRGFGASSEERLAETVVLGEELQCNDDAFSQVPFSQIDIPLQAGTTYYIMVQGFGQIPGEFHLNCLLLSPP